MIFKLNPLMPPPVETFVATNLTGILRRLMRTRQTGLLRIRQPGQEGMLATENGMMVNAKTGPYAGMHALFQFVGWKEAQFEFQEKTLPADLGRDLAVYDPEVLIAGLEAKMKEFPR
jgi:hypothetical protein